MDLKATRTRMAPTPSGYLHAGNVLSFIITAALAERCGASIFLRIDDVDQLRTDVRFVQDIFDTLHFMRLPRHEGPQGCEDFEAHYSQLHRTALYNAAIQQLIDEGKVYACTCTRSDLLQGSPLSIYQGTCRHKGLPADMPGSSLRLYTDPGTTMTIHTTHGTGQYTLPAEVTDFVVRRKDGNAGYQLTSVIDDLHFGIDLVVRGADLWPSTVAQQYLALQLSQPRFADVLFHHHPLLLADDGVKLSKSDGAPSLQRMIKEGRTAGDVCTLLAGWLRIPAQPQSWQELAALLPL